MQDTGQGPQPTMEYTPPVERKPDDAAAMTIEFLRARLLSERSVSRAARQRADQLAEKVRELEERLEAEIQLRKRLEEARFEILSKYRTELGSEYGDLFSSFYGEDGLSNAGTNNDKDAQGTNNEDEAASDCSRQLTNEETNDDDAENDSVGKEKGVLGWGRRKGSKKQLDKDSGADWLSRSISQRSFLSSDGDQSHKKWVGKSVRQIRKRESRSFDTNLEDSVQTHNPENADDNKLTEVERVLERQAELIEQFAAEENAQRAWEEAKFAEQKGLSIQGPTEGLTQDKVESGLRVSQSNDKREAVDEHTVTTEVKNDEAVVITNPVSCQNEDTVVCQNKEASTPPLVNELVKTEAPIESQQDSMSSFNSSSQCVNLNLGFEANEGIEQGAKEKDGTEIEGKPNGVHTMETPVKAEKRHVYSKHLSSSFRFAVLADPEQASSCSPEMIGFAAHKQEMEIQDDIKAEKLESPSATNNEHTEDLSTISSNGHHGNDMLSLQNAEPQVELKTQSNWTPTQSLGELSNDLVADNHTSVNDVSSRPSSTSGSSICPMQNSDERQCELKDGMTPRDRQLPPVSDAISMDRLRNQANFYGTTEPRQDLKAGQARPVPNFASQPEHTQQPQYLYTQRDRHSYVHNKGAPPLPFSHTNLYEDVDGRKSHRSLDGGFERVADVLRALQIAKHQVQTSNEHSTISVDPAYRTGGYDSRHGYYLGPPHYPPSYYSQASVHPSRAPIPGSFSGTNLGPSRQVLNQSLYSQYASRIPDRQNIWAPQPPPPHGVHSSSNYLHYDARQHR